MENIYYNVDHPAAFGGKRKLLKATGTPASAVEEFLQKSDVYTLHKPVRRHFVRRKTIARAKFELLQADLADMQKYARFNQGYKYILVAICVLSKYVFYIPVKSKQPGDMKRAFSQIFRVARPKLLHADRGKEFVAREMQQFFAENNVHWYHTYSESKATVAERQIQL